MDLQRDWLYNPEDPEATPCRWFVNVYRCRNSVFFIAGYGVGLFVAVISLLVVLMFLIRRRFNWRSDHALSRWAPPLSLCCIVAAGLVCFITHSTIVLVNPPMPYWSRDFIRALGLIFILNATIPHIIQLLGKAERGELQLSQGRKPRCALRTFMQAAPLVIVSGLILGTISFAQIDLGHPVAYRWTFTFSNLLNIYQCVVKLWFYFTYGYRFTNTVNTHLEGVKQGTPHSSHPDQNSQSHKMPTPHFSFLTMALTKMQIFYSSNVCTAILSCILLITLACLPNGVFQIRGFSEVMFCAAHVTVPLTTLITFISLVYRCFKDDQSNTQPFFQDKEQKGTLCLTDFPSPITQDQSFDHPTAKPPSC